MPYKGPYDPSKTEPEILKFWQENNFYKPEYNPETDKLMSFEEMKKDQRVAFTIINPPPNAYDRPHIGNISGYAYQDLFGRYNRMKGRKVLLQPGKDHAGQEGEAVFIKNALKPKDKDKKDFTREEFYKETYKYNEKNMALALKDEIRVGLSADFDRNLFTLDPKIVTTVLDTFMQMYKDGMVYKGVRIINWSPGMQSAISDNDTARVERESNLIYIAYPLEKFSDELSKISVANSFKENNAFSFDEYISYSDGIGWWFKELKVNEPTNIDVINSDIVTKDQGDEAIESYHAIQIGKLTFKDNLKDKEVRYIYLVRGQKADFQYILSLFKHIGSYLNTNWSFECTNASIKKLIDFFNKKSIIVATTRTETILGDSAVVVDPNDNRYKHLIGQYVLLPLINRRIPIIANSKVDQNFGTGAVKLTPAHSPEDFDMATEWNWLDKDLKRTSKDGKIFTQALGYIPEEEKSSWRSVYDKTFPVKNKETHEYRFPYYNVIWKNLKMHGPIGKYKGMSIQEAKEEVRKELEKLGLIPWTESIKQNVTICDRTKTIVEPMMSSQWFIDVNKQVRTKYDGEEKSFRQRAIEAIEKKKVKIHPENMTNKALFWLNNLRDWPISRSIWWGYRIPVWYKGEFKEEVNKEGQIIQTIGGVEIRNLVGDGKAEAEQKGLIKVQIKSPGKGWIQDNDCLDTWFSSGQWPYATLTAGNLMDTFYPTDVMETAYDILEVWVCRMIMFSLYKTRKIPFKDVFLHGLIKAEDGQKMSKSKGNVLSMDDIVNQYGADTLRLFYIVGNKAGAAYRVDWEKIKGNRNFLNKIWNASKFSLMNLEDFDPDEKIEVTNKEDKNFIKEMEKLVEEATNHIQKFRPGLAAADLYDHFWHTFADIYIESAKPRLYTKDKEGKPINQEGESLKERRSAQYTIWFSLKTYLQLLHPFIPFITEAIWQELPKQKGESKTIMYSNWPESKK